MQENVERLAVAADCETLEAMVVITACGIISRGHIIARAVVVVEGRRVSGERLGAISHRDESLGRSDGSNHDAPGIKSVDVGSVFVGDPEAPVWVEDNPFGINGDSLSPWSRIAKTVASIGRNREVREAKIAEMSSAISIKTRTGGAIGPKEPNSLLIGEEKVRRAGI